MILQVKREKIKLKSSPVIEAIVEVYKNYTMHRDHLMRVLGAFPQLPIPAPTKQPHRSRPIAWTETRTTPAASMIFVP
jgi:hypothetical protein